MLKPRSSTSSSDTAPPSGGGRRLLSTAAWLAALVVLVPLGFRSTGLRYTLPYHDYRWIRDHVLTDTRPLDTLFLGSSQSGVCIDPSAAVPGFGAERRSIVVSNAWHGRNLRYVILRDVLSRRRVRRVVMETSSLMETVRSHECFGSVALLEDAWSIPLPRAAWPGLFAPRHCRWVSDLLMPFLAPPVHALRERLMEAFPDAMGENRAAIEEMERRHGYDPRAGSMGASAPAVLPAGAALIDEREALLRRLLPSAYRFEMERSTRLCRENGVELLFLYLPPRGYGALDPRLREDLARFAPVLEPPWEEWQDASLWRDEFHVNSEGTARISAWLRSRFVDYSNPISGDEGEPRNTM